MKYKCVRCAFCLAFKIDCAKRLTRATVVSRNKHKEIQRDITVDRKNETRARAHNVEYRD